MRTPEHEHDERLLRELVFRENIPDALVKHAADILSETNITRYRLLTTRFFTRLEKYISEVE